MNISSDGTYYQINVFSGGAGGKGNHFFTTDIEQSPKICEYGATGEDLEYFIEIRSMAHIGLVS